VSEQFFSNVFDFIDNRLDTVSQITDTESIYLAEQAPNIVEWVTSPEYWNVPTTYGFYRQYQIIRDMFNLRCKICNSQDPEAIDCWGKPRSYLEAETLLVWKKEHEDFCCPKCGNTFREFVQDGIIVPFNELVCIAGMRSGKSFLGAHIGGYVEHITRSIGTKGRGELQKYLKQEKSEWFEVTFAASTATQAKETIFAKFREMRNNSPWINRHITWVKEQEKKQPKGQDTWSYAAHDDSVNDGFLQVRFNRVSSDSAGIAGKTRLFVALDELARLVTTESKRSAQELYRVLNQSLMTVRGALNRNPLFPHLGLMLSVTSPLSIDDYSMQLYSKVIGGETKRIYAWKGPTWEFNPNLVYSDFADNFAKDPVGAMRDFGADPPAAETPLFEDPLRFWKSVDYSRKPICTFKTDYITDKTGKHYIGASVDDLKYNFTDQHYIFCDAAETFDAFAIVCAHPFIVSKDSYTSSRVLDSNYIDSAPEGMIHISQTDVHPDSPMALGMNKVNTEMYDPQNLGRLITVVDFCMRIVPSRERDIWYNSVLEIIKDLSKKLKIASVSFDSWQSMAAIQSIRDMGINANKVRIKSESFLEFRAQIYNDQISLLPPSVSDSLSLSPTGVLQIATPEEFMQGESVGLIELLKLERSPDLKKIVAPRKGSVRGKGSDDVARCIVGVNAVIKDSVVNNMGTRAAAEKRKMMTSIANTQRPIIFNPRGPQ